MRQPLSPADERPNGRPYYRSDTCPECGAGLVLWDDYNETNIDEPWWDEWACPTPGCHEGKVFMDWPERGHMRHGAARVR